MNTERKKQFPPSRVEFVVDIDNEHWKKEKVSSFMSWVCCWLWTLPAGPWQAITITWRSRATSSLRHLPIQSWSGYWGTLYSHGAWRFDILKTKSLYWQADKKQVPNITVRPGVGGGSWYCVTPASFTRQLPWRHNSVCKVNTVRKTTLLFSFFLDYEEGGS